MAGTMNVNPAIGAPKAALPGVVGTPYSFTQSAFQQSASTAMVATGLSLGPEGVTLLVPTLASRLQTEGSMNPDGHGGYTGIVPGKNPVSSASGIGQTITDTGIAAVATLAANHTYIMADGQPCAPANYPAALAAGKISPSDQLLVADTAFAAATKSAATQFGSALTPAQTVAVGSIYYAQGAGVGTVLAPGGKTCMDQAAQQLSGGASATAKAYLAANPTHADALISAAAAISRANQADIAARAATYSRVNATGPSTEGATQHGLSPTNDGVPYVPAPVIWDGLDNVPWWKLEGIVLGNRNLRRIPDAVSFTIQLPPQESGNYLTTKKGGNEKVWIRLNTGLISLGDGASHQNSVTPTATGLLLNLWESRPNMITASGTTGVFMNMFGLTSLMSCTGTIDESPFWTALQRTIPGLATMGAQLSSTDFMHGVTPRAAILANENGLRVAAQDAFLELLALFKMNGIIRYHDQPSVAGGNDLIANSHGPLANNLSGYQARARVGDVHSSGYVAMNYKGRVMLGQFKSFDWSANADSPYRWDFNFTFRVMSDFVPYHVCGLPG